MIYLTVPPKESRIEALFAAGLGVIMTPKSGRRLGVIARYPCWAADTGCYTQGARFDLARYLGWLGRLGPARGSCLFATAPDVVGDARATWERSADVLPRIRRLGYPAALVAQDGAEALALEWEAFDALFIGGSTGWKLSEAAFALAAEARARGKWTHLGRVNSRRRMRVAAAAGYHSADGTQAAYGPDKRLAQMTRWLAEIRRQPPLRVA